MCYRMYKPILCGCVILVTLLSSGVESQVCPSGWESRPGDRSWCYFFANASRAKNWKAAKAACASTKAQLIKIDSSKLANWLFSETTKRIKINPYQRRWWTGLNNLKDKKTWRWLDNRGLDVKAIKWYKGNPNSPKYQFCASVYNYKTLGMFDDTCTGILPYICQRRTNIPFTCDSGWESADGTCYKYMDYRRTWFDAKQSCESIGSVLATVVDDTDNTIAGDHARDNSRDVWIGLQTKRDPSQGYQWVWANGSAPIPTQYWNGPVTVAPGQENSTCAAISASIKSAKSWVASSCYDEKMFLCEKPEGSCAPGWKSFGSYCYQFNTLYSLSYDSAMRQCQAQGARLVEIYKGEEQDFINKYLPGIRASGVYSLWIGIYDRNGDEYKFTSGRAVGPYTNWAKKPPTNTPGVKDCAYINSGDRLGRWNTINNCLTQRSFICFASSKTIIRSVTTPPPHISCPRSYGSSGSNCYRFFDQAATWLDARKACQNDGGDLAVITDDESQVYVQARVRADKWIGLNDRQNENTWVWLDQTFASTYFNWSPDKSSGGQSTANCVIMQGNNDKRGKWLDAKCGDKHGYVCQKQSLTFQTTGVPITTTSWTANCGPFWEEHSALGNCYQFRQEQYTFVNARQTCQQQGGDLASIGSLSEQNYIAARIKSMSSGSYWIGATDKTNEGGWSWIDSAPFSFLNWAAGQPDDFNKNQDCGRIMVTNGMWDDSNCYVRYGFICKKTSKAALTTKPPVTKPITPPAGKYFGCPQGFLKFQSKCYLFRRQKTSWQGAVSYCRTQGGDLTSIQSKAENNYIYSRARRYKGPMWIGLNDLKNQMNFEWTDDTPIVYTNWNKGEPNNYHGAKEDCVAMNNGGWTDYRCTEPSVVGYVCEANQLIITRTTRSPMLAGCPSGTLGYYASCYHFVPTRYLWSTAENYCVRHKGHLATVNDRYVQSFIVSELATRTGNWWIGMSDTKTPGRLRWSSGSRIYYTNWDRAHTGKEKSTCIAMSTDRPAGMWKNRKCKERNPFVCEYPRKGFTNPPTTPRPTVQVNCPAEWQEFQGFCYKGIYAYETHLRKTWTEARDYCRAYGADLASLHSSDEEDFIVNTVLDTMRYLKPGTYWIGMNDRAVQEGYEWSDGSPNDYVNWAPSQPNNHNNQEDCVEFDKDAVKWNDANCALGKSFICKIKKGQRVRTTVNPNVFTKPPHCSGSSWYSYNGSCYYYSYYGQRMTWYDARQFCLKNGGELTSIHTQDENNFITSLITKEYRTDYWIGLDELNLRSYEWTDASPLDYKNWSPNEPNDEYGGQRCVNIFNYNGEWNDNNCAQKLNFVCKRVDGNHPRLTLAPTPPIQGGCPKSFKPVGSWSSKCYLLPMDLTYVNWTTARQRCQKVAPGADLASINNYIEQQFVVSMLGGRKNRLWIGLNDLQSENKFVWADNSNVKFTFWNRGEPNGVVKTAKSGQIEDCVQMYPEYWRAGRWSDARCGLRASYACEAFKSTSIPIQPVSALPAFCNKPGYTVWEDSCYKIDKTPRTWQAANTFCQQDGARLLSVTSVYEQAFLRVFLVGKKNTYWTGLSDTQNSGQYSWSDGWPVLYTHWARKEPSKGDGEGCVAMMPNSRWNDTLCSNEYSGICKITQASKPETTPLALTRPCARASWISSNVNNYCYYYEAKSLQTWSGADYVCRRMGMQIVTITSQQEQNFILTFLSRSPNKYVNMWIGLAASDEGGFMWQDRKFADGYNNWAPSEPSNEVSSYDEDCVEMNPISGKWYDQACSSKRGFICWAAKVTSTTMVTPPPATNPVVTQAPVTRQTTRKVVTKKPLHLTSTRRTLFPIVTKGTQRTLGPKFTSTTYNVNKPTRRPWHQPLTNTGGGGGSGGGLGGGAIAGIVVAIVLIIAGIIGAGLLIHFKNIAVFNFRKQTHSSSVNKGFDNALYSKSSESVNVN